MTVKSRFNCCLQPLNMRENPPSGAREDCFFSSIIRISNVLHSRNTRASWIKLEHRCQYAFQQNTLLSKLVHTFQSQYLCLRPHWWVYGLKFLSLERKLQGGEGFFFFVVLAYTIEQQIWMSLIRTFIYQPRKMSGPAWLENDTSNREAWRVRNG